MQTEADTQTKPSHKINIARNMRIYALISSFMQYMHIYPLFRMDCTLVK